ncbi:MAG TPA: response regulator transcription factor [Candidatus Acidoferrum sp.]|nr:response regulator transcription factor [Candidatus Acidoferrum sp.]
MTRVLVVEDEAHLAQGLRFNLEAEGYQVDVAADGETALVLLSGEKKHFDLVVLDVMLPGRDGFQVASTLRSQKNYVPVLMLTARGRAEDVLKGFAAGADDYLPKPFDLPIFLARLQGLLRRREWLRDQHASSGSKSRESSRANSGAGSVPADTFSIDGKTIDLANLEIRADGSSIRLTLMEAKLLRHLIRNAGKNISRKSILEDVWGLAEDTDTRAIDNFIVRLRRYIEKDPAHPKHLLTVRGVGYKFIPASTS